MVIEKETKSKKTSAKKTSEKKKLKEIKKPQKVVKKARTEKKTKKEEIRGKNGKPTRYLEAVGRRKTAVARVRLFTQGSKEFVINKKPYKDYFTTSELQQVAAAALKRMKSLDRFKILVLVKGGGLYAQAGAVRHGTARVLVAFSPDFRKRLRRAGYLTRDPRVRERKKFGLKRARRAPQWRKR